MAKYLIAGGLVREDGRWRRPHALGAAAAVRLAATPAANQDLVGEGSPEELSMRRTAVTDIILAPIAVASLAIAGCAASDDSLVDFGWDGGSRADGSPGGDASVDGGAAPADGGPVAPTPDGGPVAPTPDGGSGPDARPPAGDGGAAIGDTSSAASWFPPTAYFNRPVDTAPVDAASQAIVARWLQNGGFGDGFMQIDFSIDVYYAGPDSVIAPFVANDNIILPDSDVPQSVPIAPNLGAATSPAPGFECAAGGSTTCDDCHYLVVDPATRRLVEVYGAVTDGKTFSVSTQPSECPRSIAIWDLTKDYPGNLRGDVCTSADASGGVIAATLFSVEEVAAGHIDHALRFILPNAAIQYDRYVRPATHGTGGSSWAMTDGVPYGARFRLKASFDATALSPGAQVVIAAMKKYGIVLQDGGTIALTAKSDAFSTLKWADHLGSHDLAKGPQPGDFELVDLSYGSDQEPSSAPHDFSSATCVRNP
jgi:hypothetical protein